MNNEYWRKWKHPSDIHYVGEERKKVPYLGSNCWSTFKKKNLSCLNLSTKTESSPKFLDILGLQFSEYPAGKAIRLQFDRYGPIHIWKQRTYLMAYPMENISGGFLPSERTTMLYCKLKHHKKYFSTESNNTDKSKLSEKITVGVTGSQLQTMPWRAHNSKSQPKALSISVSRSPK